MKLILIIAVVAIAIFLPAYIFMVAWNFVMPSLFHLPVLVYWQAFAITVILQTIGGFFSQKKD